MIIEGGGKMKFSEFVAKLSEFLNGINVVGEGVEGKSLTKFAHSFVVCTPRLESSPRAGLPQRHRKHVRDPNRDALYILQGQQSKPRM